MHRCGPCSALLQPPIDSRSDRRQRRLNRRSLANAVGEADQQSSARHSAHRHMCAPSDTAQRRLREGSEAFHTRHWTTDLCALRWTPIRWAELAASMERSRCSRHDPTAECGGRLGTDHHDSSITAVSACESLARVRWPHEVGAPCASPAVGCRAVVSRTCTVMRLRVVLLCVTAHSAALSL